MLLWIPRILGGLFISWLMGWVFFALGIHRLATPKLKVPTDGIVVFTGEPGRITAALNLFHQGWGNKLHISGTARIHPHEAITYDRAHNTEENVLFTQRWITKAHIQSIRLVTSDYHMPRCLWHAKRLWKKIEIIAHPLHLPSSSEVRLRSIVKEYHKWLWTVVETLVKNMERK